MHFLSRLLPGVVVMLAVFVAALPWGLPAPIALVLPLLPYVAIHILVERRGAAIPDWLVFLAGLAMDVLGQGPLGYWALVYLVGFIAVRAASTDRETTSAGSIALFALTQIALVLVQWLVTSIYRLRAAEIGPLLGAAAAALAVFAVVVLLFPVRAREMRRVNDRLMRGG